MKAFHLDGLMAKLKLAVEPLTGSPKGKTRSEIKILDSSSEI